MTVVISRPGGAVGTVTSANVDSSIEITARKNANSGYAGLDAAGHIGVNRINPSATNGQVLTTVAGASAWAAAAGGSLPTGVTGNAIYNVGGTFVAAGKVFSAVAYGVLGNGLTTSAAANTTNLNACIADALAAGPGSVVLHDWGGTAITNGGHFIESRLTYKWVYGSKIQLNSGAASGTNVYQTHNFATLTQTIPAAGHSQGEYEFIIEDCWIDGNAAGQTWVAPTAGGHGLAIVGFGYEIRGHCFIENCFGAGIWREYNTTQDAPSTDSGHQRASRIVSLWLANNQCNTVTAQNQRVTDGKAAVTTGQYTGWGPGDSTIGYLEAYRTGSVTGTGYQQLGLDFAAGTFRDFATLVTQLVVWGNHSIGVNLDSTWEVQYMHVEGATTVYQLNANAQENKIAAAEIFNIQTGGTLINLIGSCAHYGHWNVVCSQVQHSGTVLAVASTSAFKGGEFKLVIQLAQVTTTTLTSGAAGAITAARAFDMIVDNFGGATVTPGFCVAIPVGGTIFRYAYSAQPAQLGRGTLLAPTFSTGLAGPTNTATITAAQLQMGLIEAVPTAAATYTFDTGTNLSNQIQGQVVGETFECWLVNRAAGAFTITLATNTGITLLGTTTVAQGAIVVIRFRNTGTNAWTIYVK